MPKIVELELKGQDDMDAVQRFARENVDYISSRGAMLMSAIKSGDQGLFVVGLSKRCWLMPSPAGLPSRLPRMEKWRTCCE